MTISITKEEVKKYMLRKRVMIPLVFLLLIALYFIFRADPKLAKITLQKVEKVDLKQTVLATGLVVSEVDLDLSFNATGVLKTLEVSVGDKVKKGQILAKIDGGQAYASLTQARGGLALAQAKFARTLEGSTSEEITLAQVSLDQNVISQDLLVQTAYNNLLNSTPEAVPADGTSDYNAPKITGSYVLGKEGSIRIHPYYSANGTSFSASGLVTGSAVGNALVSQPIGNSGLYITFPEQALSAVDWIIELPNKKASNYLTNYNAYQQAVSQKELTVKKLTAELALKKAQARPSDIALAQAEITQAQGILQQAQARYEDTILRAPTDGTITSIDLKIGELSEMQKKIMTIQDVSNVYVEAKINESSIANVKIGQEVSMTLDAFGPEKIFKGTIVHVDPSATTTDGISNYKIKASIAQTEGDSILSGMNANISILTQQKPNVLVVSKTAVTTIGNDSFVNLVTNSKKKKYIEQSVETGLSGDGNMVEIIKGLQVDQEVALISK